MFPGAMLVFRIAIPEVFGWVGHMAEVKLILFERVTLDHPGGAA